MAKVGLFFYIDGNLLWHSCALEKGSADQLFINYAYSHMEIWNKFYLNKYHVDFDYYPRGRVVYRRADDTYLIYCDKCIPKDTLEPVIQDIAENNLVFQQDEHYVCHSCNAYSAP